MPQEIRLDNIGRAIYKQPIDISVACSDFGHRQVFTANFRMSNFLFKIVLDSFVFVLRQIEKSFITDIHLVGLQYIDKK